MADLSTHYKEISPEQTVQNVRKFFNDNGFTIKITENYESESSTWFCHVDLYLNDYRISGANGKGVSEIYSLASGHAELYERFCNGMIFLANPWWNRSIIEANNKKNGYYLRKDEKILSYAELTNNCFRTRHYLDTSCGADLGLQKAAVDYITNEQYIGLPMYNFADDSDIMYMDPRLLLRITHSVGMAAGNTLDEALNQGISELIEKYAQNQLFQNWDTTLYAINLKNVENPRLKEIINKIEALDYQLYLIDLSYNYNVPVMMSILIDKKYHITNINIGSFPVFDIAAERVLTELYQGHISYRNENHLVTLKKPYKMYEGNLLRFYGNSISGEILPETFLKNIEYKGTYNHDIYIDKNVTNHEIRQYYIDLSEKLNVKFYYLNNSLSNDIYAIHILCEGENAYSADELYYNSWTKTSVWLAKKQLQSLKRFYDGLYNNNVDYINLLELISTLNNPTDFIVHSFIGEIRLWNDFLISENNGLQYNNFLPFISSDNTGIIYNTVNSDVLRDVMNTVLYNPFKCFLLLKTYVMSQMYTVEEILDIFNNFFNYNIEEEDIYKCGNSSYVLKKVYIEPMYNYLHSDEYKKIINVFIK